MASPFVLAADGSPPFAVLELGEAAGARRAQDRSGAFAAAVEGARRALAEALTSEPGDGALLAFAPARRLEDIALLVAALACRVPLLLLHARESEEARREAAVRLGATHGLADDGRVYPLGPARHRWPEGDEPPAMVVLTSGSSGGAKAAVLSHRALIAATDAAVARIGLGSRDRWDLALPLAHVGGLSVLLRVWRAGAGVVLAAEGPFDAARTLARWAETAVTVSSLVPTMLTRLVALGARPPASLRAVLLGGAAAPEALVRAARALGYPVLRTYGMTETASQVATEAVPGDGLTPMPGIEARSSDGVIEVRGDALFSGYLDEPGVPRGAWWRTADLGRVDERGRLHIVGRADTVILTGGEKVAPEVVEAALRGLRGVREACVVGVPDAVWGEIVAALVVGDALDADALGREAAMSLAPHQRPRRIVVAEALPLTAAGKPDRVAVRERLAGG